MFYFHGTVGVVALSLRDVGVRSGAGRVGARTTPRVSVARGRATRGSRGGERWVAIFGS
jgi:hypothetical protein